MIYTVTLNPAFDRTIICPNLQLGELNRVSQSRQNLGGKGINVAKILKLLSVESIALGFYGELNAPAFFKGLQELELSHDFLAVKNQNTRTNYKVIDPTRQSLTEFNEKGLVLAAENENALITKIKQRLQADDYIVFSGNTPQTYSQDFILQLIEAAKTVTENIVLDLSGEILRQAIDQKPLLIKPNQLELEQLLGVSVKTKQEIIEAGLALLETGITYVLVSLGEDGSYFFANRNMPDPKSPPTGHAIYRIEPIKVEVQNPVGAGDSQVAAFLYGLIRNLSLEETLKWTSAVSTAMVEVGGTDAPSRKQITRCFDQVKIEQLF